jgi:hypothetical protein
MAKNISDDINKMFENLFKTPKSNQSEHPFYKDLKKVYEVAPKYRKAMKHAIKKKINYKIINELPNEINVNTNYEILNTKELKYLEKELFDVLNYNKILELVSYISKFLIRSNVHNENNLYEEISKGKTDEMLNIMIIGSGPVGLFLACYLHIYYNETSMNSSPRVNIVMFKIFIINFTKNILLGFKRIFHNKYIFIRICFICYS